jgi:hypothetical protein
MHAAASWFLSDPRRLCVLGVWLSLTGLVVTGASLASGLPLPGLVAGILLSASGCWAKVAGRDRFRRHRIARSRAIAAACPAGRTLPASRVA